MIRSKAYRGDNVVKNGITKGVQRYKFVEGALKKVFCCMEKHGKSVPINIVFQDW